MSLVELDLLALRHTTDEPRAFNKHFPRSLAKLAERLHRFADRSEFCVPVTGGRLHRG